MNKNLFTLLVMVFLSNTMKSQTTYLDPSFGTGGIAFPAGLNLPNQSFSNLIVQPDGKIILHDVRQLENSGGQIEVWIHRFMPNGTFDQSFGTGGSVLITQTISLFDAGDKHFQLLPNGKILTAYFDLTVFGSIQSTVVQLNANGSFDTAFGNNGHVIIQDVFPSNDNAPILRDVKRQTNGEIILIYDIAGTLDHDYGFRVLLGNGQIKPGSQSIHWWTTNAIQEQFVKALVQPNDNILMLGFEAGFPSRLERFKADATIDENFGNNGLAINSPASAGFSLKDMVLAPDGKISTCGANFIHEFWLARYLPNGAPDPDFGINGNAFHANLINTDQYFAMDLGSDGSLVVAGTKGPFTPVNAEAAVLRFLPDGGVDPTFTADGMVALTFAETGFYSYFQDVRVLSDRRILACGVSNAPENKLLMARFLPEENAVVWYHDSDGDGYGNALDSIFAADLPEGYVLNKEDCDDNNSSVNPAAIEICGNGIDDNCDGISLVDTIAPVARCVPTLKLFLDSAGLVILNANSLNDGSTDDCSGLSFSADQDTFNCPEFWVHTVTLRASDVAGNTGTCQSVVKIADQIAPVAHCRSSFILPLDPWGNASLSATDLDNSSYDNCAITNQWIENTAFGCADIGAHMVVLHLEDGYGNVSTCASMVEVADQTAPLVVCDEFSVVTLDSSGHAQITALSLDDGSYDACSPILLYAIDRSTFDCNDVGFETVTLTVTDQYGNTNSCQTLLTITDKMAPVSICEDTIMLLLDLNSMVELTSAMITSGSFDNCGIMTYEIIPAQLSSANLGFNAVSLYATDASGNSSSCTAIVEIRGTSSGTQQAEQKNRITVFPNPSNGLFELRLQNGQQYEHAEIYDATGQLVWVQSNAAASSLVLDLSGQVSGCYYLRVQTGGALRKVNLILMR